MGFVLMRRLGFFHTQLTKKGILAHTHSVQGARENKKQLYQQHATNEKRRETQHTKIATSHE
jgi:hypothetical protein